MRRNLSLFLLILSAFVGFSFIAFKISSSSINNSDNIVEGIRLVEPENVEDGVLRVSTDDLATSNVSNAIQVALILDTSTSMNGLIEQAKSQLWNILNELSKTEKEDQEIDLQIALYEYGNPQKATMDNYIHRLTDFTSDMDKVSEDLFSLTTNGGDEYCGAVIKKSLDELQWNDGNSLKMIYIAGNEPFTQGPINYKEICNQAKSNGIVVNTIFCGDQRQGMQGEWNQGAELGGGDFISISQNEETVYISTPFDDRINALNKDLNATYIPYGEKGHDKKNNQIVQDENASKYSSANSASRAKFKSSKKYKADDWDLVDAYKKDKSILNNADIKSEKYREMTITELESNIEQVIQDRESIQSEIKKLDKKRTEYITSEKKKNVSKDKSSLQQSIINTVRKQAQKKGYQIKE